jgi:hypothetical protein
MKLYTFFLQNGVNYLGNVVKTLEMLFHSESYSDDDI